jgi:hypothetical protein
MKYGQRANCKTLMASGASARHLAHAQSAVPAPSDATVEEFVVTAEKRAQLIGGVDLTITALSGVTLGQRRVHLIGLAQGAEINIVAYMTARYFGMAAYAIIYGLCVAAIGISSALGGVLFGKAYDYFGGYHQALLVSAGFFLVSALSYLAMGRYPEQPGLADGPRGSVVAPVSSAEEGVGAFSRR